MARKKLDETFGYKDFWYLKNYHKGAKLLKYTQNSLFIMLFSCIYPTSYMWDTYVNYLANREKIRGERCTKMENEY